MMDRSPKPSEALLRAIAQDLKPVKPSPAPHLLVLQMVALALLISPAIVLAIGVRPDSPLLGPLLIWGGSAMQFGLAAALIWIASRECTPAGRLPRLVVHSVIAAATVIMVSTTMLTYSISPDNEGLRQSRLHVIDNVVPPGVAPWIMALACGVGSTVMGGILVLIFSLVFRKSLVARPAVAGALYGAAAGLAINASWRVACPISTPWHALGAHGAAVIATIALGAAVGHYLARGPAMRRLSHHQQDRKSRA